MSSLKSEVQCFVFLLQHFESIVLLEMTVLELNTAFNTVGLL